VIDQLDQRHNLSINFGEVHHKATGVNGATYNNVDTVVMSVHVLAFVAVRQQWEVVCRFKSICTTDARP
jgi:hypothetical protein